MTNLVTCEYGSGCMHACKWVAHDCACACLYYVRYAGCSHRHMPVAEVAVCVHIEALAARIDSLYVPCSEMGRL